jgi:hypothetical protein
MFCAVGRCGLVSGAQQVPFCTLPLYNFVLQSQLAFGCCTLSRFSSVRLWLPLMLPPF